MPFRRNRTPAVRRLLWEIHRLRALVLRTGDLFRTVAYHRSEARLEPHSRDMLNNLRKSVESEPVVQEDAARRLDARDR